MNSCGTSIIRKSAQPPKHAYKRALVLTARKLVRLVDHLLRTGAVYRPPESRQDRKEDRTLPHAARPGPQRRAALAPSALQGHHISPPLGPRAPERLQRYGRSRLP